MTFTHSPGPWKLSEGETNNLMDLDSPGHSAFAQVVVMMQDGVSPQMGAQLRGNAQLLKHALEMYELLGLMLQYTTCDFPSGISRINMNTKIADLLKSIETIRLTREQMLEALVKTLVLSLRSSNSTRLSVAHLYFEGMDDEQLAKAYNDMQVPE